MISRNANDAVTGRLGSIKSASGLALNASGELVALDFLNYVCGHQSKVLSILQSDLQHSKSHKVSPLSVALDS